MGQGRGQGGRIGQGLPASVVKGSVTATRASAGSLSSRNSGDSSVGESWPCSSAASFRIRQRYSVTGDFVIPASVVSRRSTELLAARLPGGLGLRAVAWVGGGGAGLRQRSRALPRSTRRSAMACAEGSDGAAVVERGTGLGVV